MIPNKYGYWFIFGLILANIFKSLGLIGGFIGFFITSAAITAIFHNKKNKDFKGWEIAEIGATCSLVILIMELLLFILLNQFPAFAMNFILIQLITTFIAVCGGIWTYNKLMKIS